MVVEAKALFAQTLDEMMAEQGFSLDAYTYEECKETIERCVEEAYQSAWDEFVMWVTCGDDKRERTKLLIQGLAMGASMFRNPREIHVAARER